MAHIVVEYTDNVKQEGKIQNLLQKINHVFVERSSVFPIGGVRSRAVELTNYVVADGTGDDAFVHITVKIGSGRSYEEKEEAMNALFGVVKDHFQDIFDKRYLALSMEWEEFQNKTFKQNNIHTRYKRS